MSRNSPPLLDPDTVFGDFQIVRSLGTGTFGAVYEALWRPYRRIVALKILHAHLIQNGEALARFRREADTAAAQHHPHVVSILNVGDLDGTPYIAMECLAGESLAASLRRRKPLPLGATLDALFPIIDAVAAMHEAGFVHRDVKPANIFLSTGPHGQTIPKILDFGLAKGLEVQAQPGITHSQVVLGSPYYMSAEQIQDSRNVSAATDQFALAVVLYECLVGRRPFEGATPIKVFQETLRGTFVPASTRNPELPVALEAVFARALAVDASRRFESLRSFGAALLPFAEPSPRARWTGAFVARSQSVPPGDSIATAALRESHRALSLERARRRGADRRHGAVLILGWCATLLVATALLKHGAFASPTRWAPTPPPSVSARVIAPGPVLPVVVDTPPAPSNRLVPETEAAPTPEPEAQALRASALRASAPRALAPRAPTARRQPVRRRRPADEAPNF